MIKCGCNADKNEALSHFSVSFFFFLHCWEQSMRAYCSSALSPANAAVDTCSRDLFFLFSSCRKSCRTSDRHREEHSQYSYSGFTISAVRYLNQLPFALPVQSYSPCWGCSLFSLSMNLQVILRNQLTDHLVEEVFKVKGLLRGNRSFSQQLSGHEIVG